jgi:hypothetical protein
MPPRRRLAPASVASCILFLDRVSFPAIFGGGMRCNWSLDVEALSAGFAGPLFIGQLRR